MKSIAEVVDPDEVTIRISCMARVAAWRKVKDKLLDQDGGAYNHEVSQILGAICDAIRLVDEKIVVVSTDEKT